MDAVARYCKEICGGACCHLRLPDEGEPIPCPRLTAEKTCSVYEDRYREGSDDLVVVGYWESRRFREISGKPATRPFWCGRLLQLHAAGQVPRDVADGCVLINPQLISRLEGT